MTAQPGKIPLAHTLTRADTIMVSHDGKTSSPVSLGDLAAAFRGAVAPAPAQLPASPSGTVVASTSGGIVDADGVIWTLWQTATKGFQIALDNKLDTRTEFVIKLLKLQDKIYQANKDNNWYLRVGNDWAYVPSGDPTKAGR